MKLDPKIYRVVFVICLALAMVFASIITLRASAAPAPIVTPVSSPGERQATAQTQINFMRSKAVTADGRGTTYSLPNFNILDLQYVIDQGTTPNTVTLTIQYSCDGVNWVDGANLVASNAADASDIVQLNNYCRYTNIYANVANTETVTISVIGVAK